MPGGVNAGGTRRISVGNYADSSLDQAIFLEMDKQRGYWMLIKLRSAIALDGSTVYEGDSVSCRVSE